MEKCLCCMVSKGLLEVTEVPLQSNNVVCFMHPEPKRPVHAVVILRDATSMPEVMRTKSTLLMELGMIAQKIMAQLKMDHPGLRFSVVIEGANPDVHLMMNIVGSEKPEL